MPTPGTMHIEVPRNGDWFGEWRLENIEGEPIDLTGVTLAMDARATGGAPTIIASAVLTVTDAEEGRFNVLWRGADFDSFGDPFALSRAAYDLKLTYPDGISQIPVRGHLLITPEVTE